MSWLLAVPQWRGGSTFRDLCGYYHGTLTNMDPATDWLGALGRSGGWGCLDFDGTNDYVALPNFSALFSAQQGTFAAWLKLNQNTPAGVAQTGLTWWGAGGGFFTHYPYIDGLVYVSVFSTARPIDGVSTGVARDVWHHFCLTTAAGTGNYKLYLNGKPNTSSTNSAFNVPTAPLLGSSTTDSSYSFSGQMDDIRLYNRVLSDGEVYQVYDLSRRNYPGLLNRRQPPRYYTEQVAAATKAPPPFQRVWRVWKKVG